MTREEAIRYIDGLHYEEDFPYTDTIADFIKERNEAIDMAIEALQADRPRGTWLKVIDHDGILMEHYVCDKCGMLTTDCSDFCPNCGAKMDGEE